MSGKKVCKYRARCLAIPDWYIIERSPHYGRIGTFTQAIMATRIWWEENLAEGWENFFDLEEVEEEQYHEEVAVNP